MAELIIKTGVKRYQGKAVDLGSWSPPVLRSKTADGDIVMERIPSAGHCLMVHPNGHTTRVQLFNGMGKPSASNPYYLQISREKLKAGFIPYGQCPKIHGLQSSIPAALREGAPCRVSVSGDPIDDIHPCECVQKTIDHRMGRNNLATKKLEDKYTSKENKETNALSTAVEALVDMNKAAKAAKATKPKKGDG